MAGNVVILKAVIVMCCLLQGTLLLSVFPPGHRTAFLHSQQEQPKDISIKEWQQDIERTANEATAAAVPSRTIQSASNQHLLSLLAHPSNSGSILKLRNVKNPSDRPIASPLLTFLLRKDGIGPMPVDNSAETRRPDSVTHGVLEAGRDLLSPAIETAAGTDCAGVGADTWRRHRRPPLSGAKQEETVAMDTSGVNLLRCLLSIITSCSADVTAKGRLNMVGETTAMIERLLLMQTTHAAPEVVKLDIKHSGEQDVDNREYNLHPRVANQEALAAGVSRLSFMTSDEGDVPWQHVALLDEVLRVMETSRKTLTCHVLHQALKMADREPLNDDGASAFMQSLAKAMALHKMDENVKQLSHTDGHFNQLQMPQDGFRKMTIMGKKEESLVKTSAPIPSKLPSSLPVSLKSMLANPPNSQAFSAHTLPYPNDGKSMDSQTMSNLSLLFDKSSKSVLPRLGDVNVNGIEGAALGSGLMARERDAPRSGGAGEGRSISRERSREMTVEIEPISQSRDGRVRDNSVVTRLLSRLPVFDDKSRDLPLVDTGRAKASVNTNITRQTTLGYGWIYGGEHPNRKMHLLRRNNQALSDVIVQVKDAIGDVKSTSAEYYPSSVNDTTGVKDHALKSFNGSMPASDRDTVPHPQKYGVHSMINQVQNMPYAKQRHKRETGPAKGEIGLGSDALIKPGDKVTGNNSDIDVDESMKMPDNSSSDGLVPKEALDGELSYRSHMYLGLVDTRGRSDKNTGSWDETETEKDSDSGPHTAADDLSDVKDIEPEPESGAMSEPESTMEPVSVTESEPAEEIIDDFKNVGMAYEDYAESEVEDEYELVLPEVATGTVPEPESESEPESEPEAEGESEPESENGSDGEPESENESGTEPESEPESDNPLAEPEPEWNEAKDTWKAAWEVHVYTVGILFGILAIYSAVAILRLWRRQNLLSRGYFLSLNTMMLLMGVCRAVFFLVDGYNSQATFPPVLAYFLFGVGFPCLTSAFSILFLALYRTTRMQRLSHHILKPVVLVVIIAVHFLLSITTDFVVGYFIKAKVMLVVCQSFFVLWGLCLFCGYIFLFHKLVLSANRRHKEMTRVTESHRNLNGSPLKKPPRLTLTLAVKVTLITAILGLLAAGLQLYAMVGVYSIFSQSVPEPWPWWAFQFSMRLIELGMCFTMCYVATQPLRFHPLTTTEVGRTNGILNYLLPCQRVCTSEDVEEVVDIPDVDGLYQYPNGRFQNDSPEVPEGFDGNGTPTEYDESFPMAEESVDNKGTLSSKDKYSTTASRRSRPLSMLVDDNGFIRFRQDGETPDEGAPVMYSTDDELGSCGDILDDGMEQEVIQNGHIPQDFKAGVYLEYRPPTEDSKLQSVSVPNTGANTPMTPRSFYSADSEGAFSEVFNFRPPSSIHLRESIDRALNYPHFSIQTPDMLQTPDNLSRPGTPDNLDDGQGNGANHQPLHATQSLHCDHRIYPAYPVYPPGQHPKRKSSLRSILSHLNRSRNSSRPVSRRASEDMLSKGSMTSLGFRSTTSGFKSNGSLSFFDDMSFRTATVDKMSILEDRKNNLYRSRSNSDSLTEGMQF